MEPFFGIIKEVLGFRKFQLRGIEKVQSEWQLVCLSYNLKRLFHHLGADWAAKMAQSRLNGTYRPIQSDPYDRIPALPPGRALGSCRWWNQPRSTKTPNKPTALRIRKEKSDRFLAQSVYAFQVLAENQCSASYSQGKALDRPHDLQRVVLGQVGSENHAFRPQHLYSALDLDGNGPSSGLSAQCLWKRRIVVPM